MTVPNQPKHFDASQLADLVNARIGTDSAPRLATIMGSLVRHLHAFVQDVALTPSEWEAAITFLTETGQISDAERQEFILLSDVLGVSMLVDALEARLPADATESTVLGPFYVENAPRRAMGETISLDGRGELCLFTGHVRDLEGRPIGGAMIEVWSDNADGFYDVQQPDVQPRGNNRGRFLTVHDGHYHFIGIRPVSYPIPNDGPVGRLLVALGRHPNRPAHMHFKISAPGFRTLVTHTFVAGDPWLDSDAVFGVKPSLVASFDATPSGPTQWRSEYDFILAPLLPQADT